MLNSCGALQTGAQGQRLRILNVPSPGEPSLTAHGKHSSIRAHMASRCDSPFHNVKIFVEVCSPMGWRPSEQSGPLSKCSLAWGRWRISKAGFCTRSEKERPRSAGPFWRSPLRTECSSPQTAAGRSERWSPGTAQLPRTQCGQAGRAPRSPWVYTAYQLCGSKRTA